MCASMKQSKLHPIKSSVVAARQRSFFDSPAILSKPFAVFQCFMDIIGSYLIFGNQNRLLMKERTQILCDIIDNGFIRVNKRKH